MFVPHQSGLTHIHYPLPTVCVWLVLYDWQSWNDCRERMAGNKHRRSAFSRRPLLSRAVRWTHLCTHTRFGELTSHQSVSLKICWEQFILFVVWLLCVCCRKILNSHLNSSSNYRCSFLQTEQHNWSLATTKDFLRRSFFLTDDQRKAEHQYFIWCLCCFHSRYRTNNIWALLSVNLWWRDLVKLINNSLPASIDLICVNGNYKV